MSIPTGTYLTAVATESDDRTLGHVARLYVDPDRWGLGIGTALHDTALADLQASGFPSRDRVGSRREPPGRRWYERLGWSQGPRRKPTYEPAGIYDTQYRRELASH